MRGEECGVPRQRPVSAFHPGAGDVRNSALTRHVGRWFLDVALGGTDRADSPVNGLESTLLVRQGGATQWKIAMI